MGMNIAYCPRCGKVFAKGIRDICPACVRTIEDEYEKCLAYLKKHRSASIQELSDETEVSVRQITKFIREGRISTAEMSNLSYPCDVCGTLITSGSMCESCRQRLSKDVKHMHEDESRRDFLRQQQAANMTYKTRE